LANHKSALKRARQNIVRRERNKSVRTQAKTLEKKVFVAKEEGDENIIDIFKEAQSAIHRAAQKKIFHKKTAGRKIAKLARVLSS
jgi:small subunit ribosomal protein S20